MTAIPLSYIALSMARFADMNWETEKCRSQSHNMALGKDRPSEPSGSRKFPIRVVNFVNFQHLDTRALRLLDRH